MKLPDTLVFDFPTLRQIECTQSAVACLSLQCAIGRRGSAQSKTEDSVRLLLSSLASNTVQSPLRQRPRIHSEMIAACIHGASCKLGGGVQGITSFHDAGSVAYDAVASVPSGRWDEAVSLTSRHSTVHSCRASTYSTRGSLVSRLQKRRSWTRTSGWPWRKGMLHCTRQP